MMNRLRRTYLSARERWDRFCAWTTTKLSRAWIFGTLIKCEPKTFAGAFYEFLHGFVFATMPFWLGGLVLTVLTHVTAAPQTTPWFDSYWSNTISTFSKGELLVFAISLLTPTLWLSTHEPEGATFLPHRRPISTIAVLVVVVGAVLFSLLKAKVPLDGELVFWISVFLTCGAIGIRYIVLVYHGYRMPPMTERDITKGTEDFMAQFARHRETTG
jgi:hypothetical protein